MEMQYFETRIYRVALAVAAGVRVVAAGLPAGHGYLGDQMHRAAASILLNFAEGCGKRTRADRARFFAIARGSANEVRAAVDVALALSVVSPTVVANLPDQCAHVGNMLGKFL